MAFWVWALVPMLTWAKTYDCRIQFGETVPIRRLVLKKGVRCPHCEHPQASIPAELITPSLSKEWNPKVEKDQSLNSKVKRRVFTHDDRQIFLDTRYATQDGPKFQFELNCPDQNRCDGYFKGVANKALLEVDTSTFDQRSPNSAGHLSIQIGRRENLGFIVRVFKRNLALNPKTQVTLSASGELKFFREDPLFIHDTGVDEPLALMKNLRTRIAALESKIICQTEGTKP